MELKKPVKIDADGKAVGRLASEVAKLLIGKNNPHFVRNMEVGETVIVENVEKMKFTGKKLAQNKYFRHSPYQGGVTETPVKKVFESHPDDVLRRAVMGMLPKNKLRPRMIKRLQFAKKS